MATRYNAKIGDVVTLEAHFSIDGDAFDPYEIVKVDLLDADLVTVESVDGADVVNVSAGLYSADFGPLLVSGELCDHWHYRAVAGGDIEVAIFMVDVADVTVSAGGAPVEGEVTPLDDTSLCKITHRFFDAGGRPMKGVYVRFRPHLLPDPDNVPLPGSIAREITAVSNENGELLLEDGSYFKLVRGAQGLIAITGVGLVRNISVPDVASIDLLALPGMADDLLEPINTSFSKLIRRS